MLIDALDVVCVTGISRTSRMPHIMARLGLYVLYTATPRCFVLF